MSYVRVWRLLERDVERYVSSSAFTERIAGARSAFWAHPMALWSSVKGGALWDHGEWLELATFDWPSPESVLGQFSIKAMIGSDREKYVAYCLIGQVAPKDLKLANLCTAAARSESSGNRAGSGLPEPRSMKPGEGASWVMRMLGIG